MPSERVSTSASTIWDELNSHEPEIPDQPNHENDYRV